MIFGGNGAIRQTVCRMHDDVQVLVDAVDQSPMRGLGSCISSRMASWTRK